MPGRILIVDDDPVTGRFLSNLLGDGGGFDVACTTDPASALQRASTERWDLVLTDVEMPGMTGLELLQALRRAAPDLPVVVITGHATLDYAVSALRDHADEFLQKSMPKDTLLATIGAAGALLVHRSMGHEVSILTLSRGARGGSQDTRAGESDRAARAIGATLFLDDLKDTRISEGDPTIGAISRVVESVRPTVIYTHSSHDVHQDHRNTHRAAMVAVRGVGRVYCFQSPSATVDFRPTRFVTIDDQIEGKLQAIKAFVSQVDIRRYLEPDLIESTARYWSRFGDGRFAEAFEVIREATTEGQPAGPAPGMAEASPDSEPTELASDSRAHKEVPHAAR